MASARSACVEAYVAAVVAMLIFAVPAAIQQHRYSPIVKDPPTRTCRSTGRASFIVAAILIAAIVANVTANLKFPALLERAGARARGLGRDPR